LSRGDCRKLEESIIREKGKTRPATTFEDEKGASQPPSLPIHHQK